MDLAKTLRQAEMLAEHIWDDDALHVELSPERKAAIDSLAADILRSLGHKID